MVGKAGQGQDTSGGRRIPWGAPVPIPSADQDHEQPGDSGGSQEMAGRRWRSATAGALVRKEQGKGGTVRRGAGHRRR